MATSLEKGPLDPQLRALARSALDFCVSRLDGASAEDGGEWASRVHDTRRKLKWLRALLRAVRPALSSSTFRQEDHALRNVGRRLAAARAHEARTACLRSLVAHFSLVAEDAKEGFRSLKERAPQAEAKEAAQALGELRRLRAMDFEVLPEIDVETLITGLGDQLRRTRKAYRRARRDPTSHLMHEWRKQAKYHLHQLELVRELASDLSDRTRSMKGLSELLGEAHDVADLRQHLASRRVAPARELRVDLCALLDAREAELALHALTQGEALFRAKPRELRALLERHLR